MFKVTPFYGINRFYPVEKFITNPRENVIFIGHHNRCMQAMARLHLPIKGLCQPNVYIITTHWIIHVAVATRRFAWSNATSSKSIRAVNFCRALVKYAAMISGFLQEYNIVKIRPYYTIVRLDDSSVSAKFSKFSPWRHVLARWFFRVSIKTRHRPIGNDGQFSAGDGAVPTAISLNWKTEAAAKYPPMGRWGGKEAERARAARDPRVSPFIPLNRRITNEQFSD